ncbi:MAG: hypothetical protein WAM39_17185 [Bryobacteraceae bacterium]
MSKVEKIESEVKDLSPDELRTFRTWFAQFDAEVWDQQIADDVKNNRLRDPAERALHDHASGRSTVL